MKKMQTKSLNIRVRAYALAVYILPIKCIHIKKM